LVTRGTRGYSLIEVIVSMAVFSTFIAIFFILTADMRRWEKRLPVNFMKNPQVGSVLSRLRRDVLDAHGTDPYRNEYEGYEASAQVLIIDTIQPDGLRTVVWDFRTPGVVRRRSYNVGVARDWVARGMPQGLQKFEIGAVSTNAAAWATEIKAKDEEGRLAIHQIYQPRATVEPPTTPE
jgi:prepilin-type N-terminal cleavage/methylation domain-containing protein